MSLAAKITLGSLDLTASPYGWVFGGDLGGPALVVTALQQSLADGEFVSASRTSNRTISVSVLVEATDLDVQAQAEAALVAECTKTQNLLTFDPGDGVAEPSVFETFAFLPRFRRDDGAERMGFRRWELEIPAQPFARRATPTVTVVDPPPSSITSTTVDDCSAVTYWRAEAGSESVTPVASDGHVSALASLPGSSLDGMALILTPDEPVVYGDEHYVRVEVDWSTFRWTPTSFYLIASSRPSEGLGGSIDGALVAQSGRAYWFDVTGLDNLGAQIDELRLVLLGAATYPGQGADITLSAYDVSVTNATADSDADKKQLQRTVPIGGTARTPATIELSRKTGTDALGHVIVHTMPSNVALAQPNMRRNLVAGGEDTDDGTTVSGTRTDMSAGAVFQVPVGQIVPGGHLLVARMSCSATATKTVGWQAGARWAGSSLEPIDQSGTISHTFTADTWDLVTLGLLNLPTEPMGPEGLVGIVVTPPTADPTLLWDEVWLFNIDDGELTMLDMGSGSAVTGEAFSRLWLDSASLANPQPQAWVGTKEQRTDAVGAGSLLQSWGNHETIPKSLNIFTACSDSDETVVTVTAYDRFLNHVTKAAS